MATSTTEQTVSKILEQAGELCTLPEAAAKIMELVEDPNSTAKDLHDVIKNDPVVAAKVLKMVNSPFYGIPGSIKTIDRAVVSLGLKAVKNIAIACSVGQMFSGAKITDQYGAKDLWQHCMAVGVLARALAQLAKLPDKEELFLAGLIHDLGILLIHQTFGTQLADVIDQTSERESYLACEQRILNIDHQVLGEALAEQWRFSESIRACVGHHHDAVSADSDLQQKAAIVQLADVIACHQQIGFYLTAENAEVTPKLIELVGVNQSVIDGFLAGIGFEQERRATEDLLL